MRLFVLAALIVSTLLSGCASVAYDYDAQAHFPTTGTYLLSPLKPAEIEGLDDRRIRTRLDTQLQARGFKPSDNKPDFVVRYGLTEQVRLDHSGPVFGFGTARRNAAFGVATAAPVREVPETRVLVEFIDPNNQQVIWQANGLKPMSVGMSSANRNEVIDSQIDEMLTGYPPSK